MKTGYIMSRLNIRITLKFLILLAFIGLISLSPSIKIIPRNLIITSFHDSQRLAELVLIGLILLYSIAYTSYKTQRTTSKLIHYVIYTLVALAITSSYLAISPRHAIVEVSLFAGLVYLALFVAHLYYENNTQLARQLTYALWAGILLSMVAFYVGYITATIFKTPVVWPGPIAGFSSVRFFNQFQLWGLGLITLPLLAFDFRNTKTRYWLQLGLILWWIMLFYSASRGVLLAWGVGILITALICRKLAWPFIRLQLAHICAGFIGYQILFNAIPVLRNSAVVTGTIIRDTTQDRIELWTQSINLIQEHPIFGIGPMHFAWYSNYISAHPHNSLLQIMAEWGLPAAILIIATAVYSLFCWLKKFNIENLQTRTRFDCNLAVVLFFTLITNAAYSLVDGVIVMPISQIMMFTIIGLMIGFYNHENHTEIKGNFLFKRVFACIVLVTLMSSTLPEILQSASGNEKRFSMGYTATGPRIWQELK